jgi:hypothetical protein
MVPVATNQTTIIRVTTLQHQRQAAFARKDAIERELLALVTAPVPNTPA